MTEPRTCAYCGASYPAGPRECPSCRFPDLDAPAPPTTPPPSKSPATATKPVPRRRENATCPHCGASFDARRPACPGCGSDAETGWKSGDEIEYQAEALPEDDPEAYREALLGDRPGDVTLWGSRRTRNVVVLSLLLAAMILPLLLVLRHFLR